jgi:hypothetical protein
VSDTAHLAGIYYTDRGVDYLVGLTRKLAVDLLGYRDAWRRLAARGRRLYGIEFFDDPPVAWFGTLVGTDLPDGVWSQVDGAAAGRFRVAGPEVYAPAYMLVVETGVYWAADPRRRYDNEPVETHILPWATIERVAAGDLELLYPPPPEEEEDDAERDQRELDSDDELEATPLP